MLRGQLQTHLQDLHPITLKQNPTPCVPAIAGKSLLRLLCMRYNVVLGPCGKFKGVQRFASVSAGYGNAPRGADLYRAENADQRIARQSSLKQPRELAVSVREVFSVLVCRAAV